MKLIFIRPVSLILALLLPLISFSQALIQTPSFNQGEYNLSIQNLPTGVNNIFWIFGDGHFAYGLSPTHHLGNNHGNFPTAYLLKRYDPQPPSKVSSYGSNCCYGTGPSSIPNQNPRISMHMGQYLKFGTSWNPVAGQKHYTILTFENAGALLLNGEATVSFPIPSDIASINVYPWENNEDWYDNLQIDQSNKIITFDCSNMVPGEQRHLLIETILSSTLSNSTLLGSTIDVNAELRHAGSGDFISSTHKTLRTSRYPHDPNDKIVSEEIACAYKQASNTLTYTINFQNIGNDFAHDILIHDDLPDLLDVNTVNLVASSPSLHSKICPAF